MTDEIMIHQDVLYQPHCTGAAFLRDWLDSIIRTHEPTNECPEPMVSISDNGLLVRWTTKGWHTDDAPHERVGKGQLPG